jgi:hypothetical protein
MLLSRAVIILTFVAAPSLTRGVILFSTGDPSANTTAPTGTLAGSGWQYEATFGSFLGTAIDPHHFITVKHIGIASSVFVYQGVNYTVVNWFDDPYTDLRIFEVAETIPTYATMYSRSDEVGRDLVVIGRGTQRGDPVFLGSTLAGWNWGPGDGVQRWGQNQVSGLNGFFLYATFDQKPNEAHLSSGDSGGAVFINDGSGWKLAGINYGIDNFVSATAGGSALTAAMFDTRGFYDVSQQLVTGGAPVPAGFYAIRISDRLSWIQTIIPPITPTATPTPTPTPAPTPTPTPTPSSRAQMLSPAPGSTFTSLRETFSWSAGSAAAYKLFVGNSVGSYDIYNSGRLSVRSVTVGSIPTTGSTIHVRLLSLIAGTWQYMDYSYKAYSSTPGPTPTPTPTPTPGPSPTGTPKPDPTPGRTPPGGGGQ